MDYIICKMQHSTFCIIFYSQSDRDNFGIHGLAMDMLRTFAVKYSMVNVYLSLIYRNIGLLFHSCMAAYQELSCTIVLGESRLWEEGKCMHNQDTAEMEKRLSDFKNQIEKYMKAKNEEELFGLIKQFLENNETKEYPAIFMKRIVIGTVEKMLEISNIAMGENILAVVEQQLSFCYSRTDVAELILSVYRKIEKKELELTDVSHEELSQNILQFMKEHVYEKVSLKDIAERFHFTESYIVRILSQQTGNTPMKWLIIYKIEEAKNMFLLNPKLKIRYVSEQLGFSDQRYFCKVFKNQTGMTVSEYKETFYGQKE